MCAGVEITQQSESVQTKGNGKRFGGRGLVGCALRVVSHVVPLLRFHEFAITGDKTVTKCILQSSILNSVAELFQSTLCEPGVSHCVCLIPSKKNTCSM